MTSVTSEGGYVVSESRLSTEAQPSFVRAVQDSGPRLVDIHAPDSCDRIAPVFAQVVGSLCIEAHFGKPNDPPPRSVGLDRTSSEGLCKCIP